MLGHWIKAIYFVQSKIANNEAIDKCNVQKMLVKAWEGLTL